MHQIEVTAAVLAVLALKGIGLFGLTYFAARLAIRHERKSA
jgi:hypothetical protein